MVAFYMSNIDLVFDIFQSVFIYNAQSIPNIMVSRCHKL